MGKKTLFAALMFAVVLSFGFRNHAGRTHKEEIYGFWQGSYGTADSIGKFVVSLKPDNAMDYYEGAMDSANKISGTYVFKGDTSVVIEYKKGDGATQVRLVGTINKNRNFVDGYWETNGSMKGNFYLQKDKSLYVYSTEP